MDFTKYVPCKPFEFKSRTWPGKTITKAPVWCSVDLRDGNQALINPMNIGQKIEFFNYLVKMGFKEIEIGFPASSQTEYDFTRKLIEDNLIPEDVTIQVLTQVKDDLIKRTFESIKGVKKAIVHVYNSTSTLQRDVVFNSSKGEIKELAVYGAKLVKETAAEYKEEEFIFQYSPESFTGTEMDYAVEVVNAVLEIWQPTLQNKAIINLPATVEMTTPNVYADQIEYMCQNIKNREAVIISIHTHNDRGTGVAASELGLLAGADRIEGTLFGNGERTGNADIVNMALNMYTQGIDPELALSDINDIIEIYEKSTQLKIHPRHPYAGSLVFTAFSGSHQDAIHKGMAAMENHPAIWEVPYLTIDPKEIGRTYEAIIRINSQSGRGGVSYILEQNFSLQVPKTMMQDFGKVVKVFSDKKGTEITVDEIYSLFLNEYVNLETPVNLVSYNETTNGESYVYSKITMNGKEIDVDGYGNGLVDAFCLGIIKNIHKNFEIMHYSQHATEGGTKSRAMTYIGIKDDDGKHYYGAGHSSNISKSSIKAVISAVNKLLIAQ